MAMMDVTHLSVLCLLCTVGPSRQTAQVFLVKSAHYHSLAGTEPCTNCQPFLPANSDDVPHDTGLRPGVHQLHPRSHQRLSCFGTSSCFGPLDFTAGLPWEGSKGVYDFRHAACHLTVHTLEQPVGVPPCRPPQMHCLSDPRTYWSTAMFQNHLSIPRGVYPSLLTSAQVDALPPLPPQVVVQYWHLAQHDSQACNTDTRASPVVGVLLVLV